MYIVYIGYDMDITQMLAEKQPKVARRSTCLSERRARVAALAENMVDKLDASEITITFKDKYLNNFDDMDDVIRIIKHYFRFLPLSGITEIMLVSEYGNNSRLHFHGVIRGKRKDLASLRLWLRKRFGFSSISMIQKPDNYIKYLQKEECEDIIHYNYDEDDD